MDCLLPHIVRLSGAAVPETAWGCWRWSIMVASTDAQACEARCKTMRKRPSAEPRGKRRGSYGILKAFVMFIAGLTLFLGARELASLRPLDKYIDEGIVSFIPVDVVSDTRHYVRPHRWVYGFWTTEYWVVYESREPRRYEWRDYVGDDGDSAYRELLVGDALKKRVLIMTDGDYLVVEPDETPERYVYNKLRAIGVSALMCVSLIAWCIVPWMRENCFGPEKKKMVMKF